MEKLECMKFRVVILWRFNCISTSTSRKASATDFILRQVRVAHGSPNTNPLSADILKHDDVNRMQLFYASPMSNRATFSILKLNALNRFTLTVLYLSPNRSWEEVCRSITVTSVWLIYVMGSHKRANIFLPSVLANDYQKIFLTCKQMNTFVGECNIYSKSLLTYQTTRKRHYEYLEAYFNKLLLSNCETFMV